MNHLNKKGITIIEILLCFVLVTGITASLFSSLNNYKEKQQLESNRTAIIKYKNLLTKDIQDDLILIGLKDVDISIDDTQFRYIKYMITLKLKDNTERYLTIHKQLSLYEDELTSPSQTDVNDYFTIQYGKLNDIIDYPLPNIGSITKDNGKIVYDLKINNIDINTDNNILNIYIGLYHPDFSTRYAIDIVCPINY